MNEGIITNKIANIEEYIPNIDKFRIRLDANESPYLPSEKILREFADEIKSVEFNRYPDPTAGELITKYSEIVGVENNCIVAGNGSDELISLICSAFAESDDIVTVVTPDFSMYEFYAKFAGAQIDRYEKDDNFDFDLNKLAEHINKNRSKLLIFSNPCNPTGGFKRCVELEKFIKNVNSKTLIVIDEAYMEFASPEKESIADAAVKAGNVIVLKTLSKAFGSAALRVGFAIADPEIVSCLKKVKSPYNLNAISQKFAKIVIENFGEVKDKANKLKAETGIMHMKLVELHNENIKDVLPTNANFNLLRMKNINSAIEVFEELKKRGIAVRIFKALSSLRITTGTPEENCEVIKALEEILANGCE